MKSLAASVIGGFLTLFGCVDIHAPMRVQAGGLTQARIDAISATCGAPREMARLEAGEVVVGGARHPTMRDCILDALEATGETDLPIVGSEAYVTPDR